MFSRQCLGFFVIFAGALLTACGESSSDGITVVQEPESATPDTPRDTQCQTDLAFMQAQAWPQVLSQCATCHNAGGLAGTTEFLLANSASEASQNWALTLDYEAANSGLLLKKAMANGVTHSGGRIINNGSSNHEIFIEMLERFRQPISQCDSDDDPAAPTSSIDPSQLRSLLQQAPADVIYRKLALLISGELPSDAQLAAITDNNLKANVRALMAGDEFEQFLMNGANDQLLTMKWASDRTSGLSALNSEYFYPQINSRIAPLEQQVQNLQDTGAAQADIDVAQRLLWRTRTQTNLALAQEPLRLIVHVAKNERPYSEVLTADYILVNPYTNAVFDTGLSFTNPDDANDWQPAQINQGYRNGGDLPHAGILTSPMFLARYPSTDTNRNRARARWSYYFFLGLDIEGLATRPMNSDSLMDVENPTLNNPDCAVCHEIMDPVAGAFQNWGNDGQFRDQCGWFRNETPPEYGAWLCDQDALPWLGYKENFNPYVEGDLWYRDMRSPGFNGALLPSSQKHNSLAWLANEMSNDNRFAKGTVEFWFKGLFGREPTPLPSSSNTSNTSDPVFDGLVAAHQLDQLYIEEFASSFANGTAGTSSHGAFNLKDLLVDMLVSPLMQSNGVNTDLTATQQSGLSQTGAGRLLTPEQLNRKLSVLLGTTWGHIWDANRNQLLEDFYAFYGGIDSDGVTDRNTQLNALMATVVERFTGEMSCRLVIDDYEKPTNQRTLFPFTQISDTPDTSTGQSNIKNNIEHLIKHLWGANNVNDEEINAAYDLFVALRNERINNNATTYLATNADSELTDVHDEFCQLDWDNEAALRMDSNQVVRPWMGLMLYLLSDYHVLYF